MCVAIGVGAERSYLLDNRANGLSVVHTKVSLLRDRVQFEVDFVLKLLLQVLQRYTVEFWIVVIAENLVNMHSLKVIFVTVAVLDCQLL